MCAYACVHCAFVCTLWLGVYLWGGTCCDCPAQDVCSTHTPPHRTSVVGCQPLTRGTNTASKEILGPQTWDRL